MFKILLKILLSICISLILFVKTSFSDTIESIEILGNERISKETILMFSELQSNENLNDISLNDILKKLYDTNYFKNVSVSIVNKILKINVEENPIVGLINIEGIKSENFKSEIIKTLKLKSRTSFNVFDLEKDKNTIIELLKSRSYYNSITEVFTKTNENKTIDITYKINLGKKAKISKISFIGNKVYKDNKLKSIIVSEEYKPWKFISRKKYVNEQMISLDRRLLKNFYLNKGFYNVKINSSFAKSLDENSFEIIYNINADEKIYFNNLQLTLPIDFTKNNFDQIYKLFEKIKNEPYSINRIEKILQKLDTISTLDEFVSTKSFVNEEIVDNKINLDFIIEEADRIFVKKINILGNNVTRENVIRNQLEIDEGDPFNEILLSKSINNLKNLYFFKKVEVEERFDDNSNSKIINITVEEKATGEIMAGAGVGTSGGTVSFGIKENNYLGKGIKLTSDLTLNEDSIKGRFLVENPNYKNSDKSVKVSVQSIETNKLADFGYKTNKTGFVLGTSFEYYDDLILGIEGESFYERIETDSTASARQQEQKGDYFDNFINLTFDYDKRNQKFQTTDGYRSFFAAGLPLVSETNTFTNTILINNFVEYLDDNVFKSSFYFKSANSLSGDNIKLSERMNIPSSRLRGFEFGKVGPKDGNDYIGGNFISSLNFSSTVPQILENSQSTDFKVFLDIANVWGVDYDSSLDISDDIRSSIGLALDWYSTIGPINFSLSQPLSKSSTDVTETFRFNLGTTF